MKYETKPIKKYMNQLDM